MLKKFTAPERPHLFFVLSVFMLLSTVASTDVVVNPDGSQTIENLPPGVSIPAVSQEGITVSQEGTTVNFNDLASGQEVSPDRYYIEARLRIEIGPTTSGRFIGSLTGTPCDGTRSLKPDPFGGPSFLLRFPYGVTSVSVDVGDIGPSDEDKIIVKAFSDDSLLTLIDVKSASIPQGAPTGCVTLSVQAMIMASGLLIPIKAVEITSESVYVLSSNSPAGVSSYPNSIFMDNVTFEPVPQTVP
jgi:hypothetical protein